MKLMSGAAQPWLKLWAEPEAAQTRIMMKMDRKSMVSQMPKSLNKQVLYTES